MPRRAYLGCIYVGLIVLFTIAGCGKSDSQADSEKPDAPPPAPTKAVSEQDDLLGSWYTILPDTRQDVLGLEFGKDGKVMLTMQNMQVVTCDYSVIDGGRVRIVSPDGQTMLFQCKVDKQSLLLDPQGAGMLSKMQFRRLDGQTIADAHKQQLQEAAKRRADMLAAVQKQLEQPNLVLVSSDPSLHLSRYALSGKAQPGGWAGIIYSEGNPPLARQAQMSIQQSDPPRVTINAGPVIGPAGEGQRNAMNIVLSATGEPDKLVLSDKGLAMRSDAGVHDELLKKYKTVADERAKLIDDFAAQFESFSRFEGEMGYPNNPNAKPRAVAVGLLRVEGKPQFMVADMSRNDNPAPENFNQTAVVQLVNGKPILVVPQWQGALQANNSDGVITLEGQLQNMAGQLKSTRIMSKAQLQAQRDVVTEFLDRQLPAGIVLSGTEWVDGKAAMPVPVSLELKADAQHNLTGVLKALQMGGDFAVTGKIEPTLLGAAFKVEGPVRERLKAASNQLGRTRSATVSVQWQDGRPRFISDIRGGYQTGPAELTLASPERMKSEKDKVRAALTAGGDFILTDPNRFVRDKVQLQLKLDPSGEKVTGQSSESRYWGGGAITGELKEQDGLPYLSLNLATMKNQHGYRLPARQISLWVLVDEKGDLALSGWSLPDTSNPPMIDTLKLVLVK